MEKANHLQTHGVAMGTKTEGYRMVFVSACEHASCAFIFASRRAMIKYVLRAASTLKNTDGEHRALRKFSRRNLDFSLLKRNVLRHAIWLTPLNQ